VVLWVNLCGAGEAAGEPRASSDGAEVVTGTAGAGKGVVGFELEEDGLSPLSDLFVVDAATGTWSGVGDRIDFRSMLEKFSFFSRST
jgi:hypothetical protein